LIIDFSEVPYIDSTGLGFLAGSRVTAQNAGAALVLMSLNQHVRRILDGVRLTPFFVVADDEAVALTKVNEALASIPETVLPAAKSAGRKRSPAPAAD
jgi:anti-anti-sigma regulatory factor